MLSCQAPLIAFGASAVMQQHTQHWLLGSLANVRPLFVRPMGAQGWIAYRQLESRAKEGDDIKEELKEGRKRSKRILHRATPTL